MIITGALFETLCNSLNEPMLILDHKKNIKCVNDAFLIRFKIDKEKVIEKHSASLGEILDISFDYNFRDWHDRKLDHKKIINCYAEDNHKSLESYEITIINNINNDDESSNFIIIFNEDSNIKILQEELNKAKSNEIFAKRVKTDFIIGLSHELRTPLNGVIGFSDLLLNTGLDKEQSEYLDYIIKSSNILLELINDIVEISRIDSGIYEANYEKIDFLGLMINIEGIIKKKANSRNVELTWKRGKFPTIIFNDSRAIRQILISIISSVLYLSRGKWTNITIEEGSDNYKNGIFFEIVFENPGIDKKKLEDLFEPFPNSKIPVKNEFGEISLQMSIAYMLVENINGIFNLSEITEKQATFKIFIPSNLEKLPDYQDEHKSQNISDKRITDPKIVDENLTGFPKKFYDKYNILVVDDIPTHRLLMEKVLIARGYSVLLAKDYDEVWQRLREEKISVILLDLSLPDKSGFDILHELRENHLYKDIPVIAVTSHVERESRERAMESGFQGFCQKPVNFNNLFSLMNKLIRDA